MRGPGSPPACGSGGDAAARPVLLVDFDGVVGLPGGKPSRNQRARFEAWFRARPGEAYYGLAFNIRVPVGMRDRFSRLEAAYECVWCSTWQGDAPARLAPLVGFGRGWRFVAFPWDWDWRMGKVPRVREWCDENAPGRKVAWVDDAVGADGDAWVKERGRDLTLLVRVDAREGLNEEQVTLLLEWATG